MASLSEWLAGVNSSLGGTSTASFSNVQKTINGTTVNVSSGYHGDISTTLLKFFIMNRISPASTIPVDYRVSKLDCQVQTTIPNGFDVSVTDTGTFTSTTSPKSVLFSYTFTQVLYGHEENFCVLVGDSHTATITVTVVNLTPSEEYTLSYTIDGTAKSVKATSDSSGVAIFTVSGANVGVFIFTKLA